MTRPVRESTRCSSQKILSPNWVEETMLRKLPIAQRIVFQQPTPEIDSRRLAQIHELNALLQQMISPILGRGDAGRFSS
ncbi:unnamed protein product [Staurois parvus]|uniref:Uncharacterized protein n=1 Tax=Staurois parvus TaxID=386267 RepID=A0ABN9GX11_9NEOB|nr:unnamed protein product [Staurois parvus]